MKIKIVEVENLFISFKVGKQNVPVIKGISTDIYNGEFLIIVGPSGCGKSTLLHSILGLEPPTRGRIKIAGRDVYAGTTEDERSTLRMHVIGTVYQQPNWINSLNVIENVAFPLILKGYVSSQAKQIARKLLEKVNMQAWEKYSPHELSSGQQQKIALCRALITDPEILIMDEPTGNLDYESGIELMNILKGLNTEFKKTILMVTHDLEYLKYAGRAIKIRNGQIEE